MAQQHERMFYEVGWRAWARREPMPLPWWTQQYFRAWVDPFDSGLFDSKEAAFSSNALYRYWNMVGVKDHRQESLVGQSGEVEPVYDRYSLGFFLFDPADRSLHFPQRPDPDARGPVLTQSIEDGHLPVVMTSYRAIGVTVDEKVFATTLGARQRSVAVARLRVTSEDAPRSGWLCLTVSPVGPSGFQRHDRAGRYLEDGRVSFMRYVPATGLVEVNTTWGPVFDTPPAHFGTYGNPGGTEDPEHYLTDSPFRELADHGRLNGADEATDHVGGLCTGVFAWPFEITNAQPRFELAVKLPVDDYRGTDIDEIRAADPAALETANRDFWTGKLRAEGLQASLPAEVTHLFDLFRFCRATVLMLSDDGAIHPGPTIYDSFWVRDSSVEGICGALVGDSGLAERQFGDHYPRIYNQGNGWIGPAREQGFFGGEHERNDREWDSNGQALWALGRYDRIAGSSAAFGSRMYSPYVLGGARWIRDNRSEFGLLHSGWSAEHLGENNKPHYWDDFWAVAGLYEAGRLAGRLGTPERDELWHIYDDVRGATRDSVLWALGEQRRHGHWETFIPTGPADVGRLDSTIIGAVAYFHPCRLYMGQKLGAEVDVGARHTLETIWSHFVEGGFRHDAAWHAYGPYLTLQLAHAFLLIGDIERMDQCLGWAVGNAAFSTVSRRDGDPTYPWQTVLGAWNEQHAYPIADDFSPPPHDWWYMGDIPHGWAAAEFNLLLRDMLLFEADEDGDRHIYIAAGVLPRWMGDGEEVLLSDAPTCFGAPLGYRLTHHRHDRLVEIDIDTAPAGVALVYPCRFGSEVRTVRVDDVAVHHTGRDIRIPAGSHRITISYA